MPATDREAAMGPLADEDLRWLSEDAERPAVDDTPATGPDGDRTGVHHDPDDAESLRGAFVEAFNARDLDTMLELLADDAEWEDASSEGREAVAEEVVGVWERAPEVVLTRAFDDDGPCAVAWRPDGRGAWIRAALVCIDVADGLISLVEIPDDPEQLASVTAEDPAGDDPDEWVDWREDDPPGAAD